MDLWHGEALPVMNGVNDLPFWIPANRLTVYCEVKVGGVKDAIERLARALPARARGADQQ